MTDTVSDDDVVDQNEIERLSAERAALYPDLLPLRTQDDARAFAKRESFRVGNRTFVRHSADSYTDGKIIVYHDQQDTTAWAARTVDMAIRTVYHWAPEYAVSKLLKAAAAV